MLCVLDHNLKNEVISFQKGAATLHRRTEGSGCSRLRVKSWAFERTEVYQSRFLKVSPVSRHSYPDLSFTSLKRGLEFGVWENMTIKPRMDIFPSVPTMQPEGTATGKTQSPSA